MAFQRKIMYGLQQAIQDIKTWCTNTFAAKSHTHTDLVGVKLTMSVKTVHGVTWLVKEYSNGYVEMCNLTKIGVTSTNTSADGYINHYARWVYLPVTMNNTNYHINVSTRSQYGLFKWGSGLCGYSGIALEGATGAYVNTSPNNTWKSYTDKICLLICTHYSSYDVYICGKKA